MPGLVGGSGDHQLNAIKAEKLPQVESPLCLATDAEIRAATGCGPGSLGPIQLPLDIIADHAALACADFVCGANRDGHHLTGANWERDCPTPMAADIRDVVTGDPSPDGAGKLVIRRGIEVGHIFQLGTKYSQAMNARITDEGGREQVMVMGCYGIGISRAVAAAIEQHHDARGIVWPPGMAPFGVAIVPVNAHQSDLVRDTGEALYDELVAAGHEVLLMDRPKARLGAMLADVELIGIPTVLVVGERGLAEGNVECRNRRDGTQTELKIDTVVTWLATQS